MSHCLHYGKYLGIKKILFKEINGRPNFKALCCRLSEIEEIINNDTNIVAEIRKEKEELFQQWKDKVEKCFKEINPATNPKLMIREISDCLLQAYSDAVIVDQYGVYDVLLNYWNEKLQDDIYVILNLGYVAAREIEYIYKQKKEKKMVWSKWLTTKQRLNHLMGY